MPNISQTQKHPRGDISIIIIVILLLTILAGTIWYAFWGRTNNSSTNNSPNPSTATSVTPRSAYEGWKSFTLKYEKITFQYPADWKLTDSSTSDPIQDRIKLDSPDGFMIGIQTGAGGIGGSCATCKAYETTTGTILGEKTGINIFGDDTGAKGIGLMRLTSDGKTSYDCAGLCTLPSKNTPAIFEDGNRGSDIIVGAYMLSEAEAIKLGSSFKSFKYETLKADPNIATAKLIFQSMSY